jgi:predicted DNA-binding protein YlxM (UPF0122 family)
MEDRFKLSILVDLYGALLTDKQKDILILYYNDDLSLAEIAEIMNTSRQAVFDLIKRCHKMLLDYESKLKLLENENKKKLFKNNLLDMLDSLSNQSKDSDSIDKIKAYVIENI